MNTKLKGSKKRLDASQLGKAVLGAALDKMGTPAKQKRPAKGKK